MRKSYAVIAALLPCVAVAQKSAGDQDLSKLGIEDLMKIEVTTASKQAEDLLHVPAAIYVVTQEQIKRSGATNVPDALRMVPGLQVAQIDANKWMISIRGFNSRFANKLLVLIDGRSVYTPLFSGVYWDAQDVDLQDVDRIEVIRGPGGDLWGANAVNGIINIITKNSAETQGFAANAEASQAEPAIGSIRYGDKLGDKGFYRAYAKYRRVQGLPTTLNTPGVDGWEAARGGFRADWAKGDESFMLSGDVDSLHEGQTSLFPIFDPPYAQLETDKFSGSNWDLVGRWQSRGAAVQISFDHSDRSVPEAGEKRDTFDVDFQQPFTLARNNKLIWGLGYRSSQDHTTATSHVSFDPASRLDQLFSGFVHDEVALRPNLTLSLGSKIEHNEYTGWETQPSARMIWTRSNRESIWASVSRAVRTPSRADAGSIVNYAVMPGPGGIPLELRFIGNPDFKSEDVVAHEIGWRYLASDRLFVDVTAFYNRYNNLRTFSALAPFMEGGHLVQPYLYANGLDADTAGLEFATEFQPTPKWRLDASASLFSARFRFDPGVVDPLGTVGADRQGITPHTQLSVHSMLDLPSHVKFDTNLYSVGGLTYQSVAAYARLDARLAWQANDHTELSVGGQNLLNARHREAISALFEVPALIERSIYAQMTFKF